MYQRQTHKHSEEAVKAYKKLLAACASGEDLDNNKDSVKLIQKVYFTSEDEVLTDIDVLLTTMGLSIEHIPIFVK